MEMLKEIQPELMLALIGISLAFAILILLSKGLSRKRRIAIATIELIAALLLCCDRIAYNFDGDTSDIGFTMAKVSNVLLFLLSPLCAFAFDHYIMNLFREDLKLKIPRRLWAVGIISLSGVLFVIIASFIPDLLFYLDEANVYNRGPAFVFCYIAPIVCTLLMGSVVIQYRKHFSRIICISLLLFLVGPVVGSIVQAFLYGFSFGNLAIMVASILIYIFAYLDINEKVSSANRNKIEHLEEQQRLSERLFEQTATALANAIDAKDEYTRGHSVRVAEYSKKIAERMGKSEEECRKIYYTALLHDVGKIGVADNIITKNGRLTDDEYEAIKQHPVIGNQILSSIRDYPYLSVGAHYHHERYDGKGYPDHLKGEEIPEVARIISVADAYDAMTSHRSYRAAIPQQMVREEILKNSGTQFDPEIAKIMQHLIDIDDEYKMKELTEATQLHGDGALVCGEFGQSVSEGILLSKQEVLVRFRYEGEGQPSIVLFDSLDANYHIDEREVRDLSVLKYGEIGFDGSFACEAARKMEVRKCHDEYGDEAGNASKAAREYRILAVRVRDHARITLDNGAEVRDVIVAFPDSARFAYIGLTGENCKIWDVSMEREEQETSASEIPRIAEEVLYTQGPEGDVPNVQVDGFRSVASKGVEITDGMTLTFHSVSLPTARLIWHCPYIVMYYSDDGEVNGKNYREYALVRLDGEYWDGVDVKNTADVCKDDFHGWEAWKEGNKEGIDVSVSFSLRPNEIQVKTANLGISLENTTRINNGKDIAYVALSGDQCALTDIRVHRK